MSSQIVAARQPAWAQYTIGRNTAAPSAWSANAIAVVISTLAPVARAGAEYGFARAIPVAFAGAGAAVGLRRWRSSRPATGRPSAVALVFLFGPAIVAAWSADRPVGVSMATGVIALLTIKGIGSPDGPAIARLRAVAAPATLAAISAVRSDSFTFIAVQLAGVGIAGSIIIPDRALAGFDRAVRRLVDMIALLVLRLAFTAIGLAVVLLPWLVMRVVRFDSTWFRHLPESRFVAVRTDLVDRRAADQWRGLVDSRPVGWRRRLHRCGLLAVVPSTIALVLVVSAEPSRPVEDQGHALKAALRNSPWWDDAKPVQWATYDQATLSAFLGPVLADVRSEATNVVDARRSSWRPPATALLTVWMFGGSTAFGIGQRDDYTIASELAKAAWDRGLPIDVVNWGVHGDVHWMEWNRLRAALIGGMDPPDLVVFYGGFNDLVTFEYVNNLRKLGDLAVVGSLDTGDLERRKLHERLLTEVARVFVDDGSLEPGRELTQAEVIDLAVRQYAASVRDSMTLLDELGLPAVVYYQPSRAARASPVDGEGAEDEKLVRLESGFASRLPEGVVDLSAVLDAIDEPIYFDSVHTNELGSRIVAEAIFADLRPQLESLAEKGDGT